MQMTFRFLGSLVLMTAAVSCGDVVRDGRSPMILVIDSLQASDAGTLTGTLLSDVAVTKAPCSPASPCTFNDMGALAIHSVPKNISIAPTTNNEVTINRYHVEYVRADGRNTPGVDVPYPFDGAITITIGSSNGATASFELVRHAAKEESPLRQLAYNPQIISTIGNVTFYGKDVTGNDISATGSLLIQFANFADK
jgi:hypothetical protein